MVSSPSSRLPGGRYQEGYRSRSSRFLGERAECSLPTQRSSSAAGWAEPAQRQAQGRSVRDAPPRGSGPLPSATQSTKWRRSTSFFSPGVSPLFTVRARVVGSKLRGGDERATAVRSATLACAFIRWKPLCTGVMWGKADAPRAEAHQGANRKYPQHIRPEASTPKNIQQAERHIDLLGDPIVAPGSRRHLRSAPCSHSPALPFDGAGGWWAAGWCSSLRSQGIAGAMGGASYKDTFSLPHTETASVANLLKNAGLNNQNGAVGTVVLKDKNGAFTGAPARPGARSGQALQRRRPRGADRDALAIHRLRNQRSRGPGNPKLLNTARGSNTALVSITWESNHYDPAAFKGVYDKLKTLQELDATGRVHRQRVQRDRSERRFRPVGLHRFRRRPDHPGPGVPYLRRDRAPAGQRDRCPGRAASA